MSNSKHTQTANQSLVFLRSDELPQTHTVADAIEASGGQATHLFGNRVIIGRVPAQARRRMRARSDVRGLHTSTISRSPAPLSETEQLGLEAWNLRQSSNFADAKAERVRDGEKWDMEDVQAVAPDGTGMHHAGESDVQGAPPAPADDMSPYLIGSVGVGVVIVEGPTADLQFSDAERAKVVAEVQEGLTWLGSREPRASVTWAYDINTVRVTVPPNPALAGYEPLEALWRDPAMAQLGYSPNFQGVRDYVASMRTSLGTRWGYVGFFTKYPLNHFAYASKPRLVMNYSNDGWGVDNIDRVFAHESGHIFGCPDEYGSSGCTCDSRFGYLQEINGNCQNCASPFEDCLMASNSWAMCRYTPTHFGWRDSDGDGTLDPVDPVSNPQVDQNRLCRRFPWLCALFKVFGLGPSGAPAPDVAAHETVPLYHLRRVLSAEEMAKVEAYLNREEDQYLEALSRKLTSAAQEIKWHREKEQAPARKSGGRKKGR
jgi:hypothetical protein